MFFSSAKCAVSISVCHFSSGKVIKQDVKRKGRKMSKVKTDGTVI